MAYQNEGPQKIVAIIGRVGKNPDQKTIPSGKTVTEFSLAVTSSVEEIDGKSQYESKWFDVSVWNEGLQDNVLAEVAKGIQVGVEGFFSTREYNGQTYPKISAYNVFLVDPLPKTAKEVQAAAPVAVAAAAAPAATMDDLPF